jgi:hypothetical protein
MGVVIVARRASKREGLSLIRLLAWSDIKRSPYTTTEKVIRGGLLISLIGLLVYVFQ